MVESRDSAKPSQPLSPFPKASPSRRGKGPPRNAMVLIAAGFFGLFMLAGVIIYLADGSRVEVPENAVAKIETNSEGGIKSITVTPNQSAAKEPGSQLESAVASFDDRDARRREPLFKGVANVNGLGMERTGVPW